MGDQRRISIVTDSVADIPRELAEEHDIEVVPLSVSVGGETFTDGTITLADFFRRMATTKELPKTSQPSAGAFAQAFGRALEKSHDVVCITISNRLSGTFESAMQAARSVGERVHVFDSLNLSWGEGYQVVEAAKAAATGASIDEVRAVFERARSAMSMIVGLDTLENLAKGGRIGRVSALVGGMLNLKVMLTVDPNGEFEPVTKSRGATAAMQASIDWLATRVDRSRPAAIGVLHARSADKAAWLEERIRASFTVGELRVIEAGPVIATHTGTGWGLTGVQLGT